MTMQVPSLSGRVTIIYENHPIATMNYLNQTQINMMQHGAISSVADQATSSLGKDQQRLR